MSRLFACAVLLPLSCLACYSTATVGQLAPADAALVDAFAIDAGLGDPPRMDAALANPPAAEPPAPDAAADSRALLADADGVARPMEASIGCADDRDCSSGLLCAGGICVQCISDQQCRLAEEPRCDDRGRCVECTSSAQCAGDRVCAPWGECERACTSTAQCAGGLRCEPVAGVCLECLTDVECRAAGEFCDEGVCRLCALEADCRR